MNAQTAGRKDRHVTKMSRKKADQLAKRNDTPLDVMIENMLFWRQSAQNLHDLINDRLDKMQVEPTNLGLVTEVKEISGNLLKAREESQKCAVDAAPYVHPKISPIKLKGAGDAARKLIDRQMDPQTAMEAYMTSLNVIDAQSTEHATMPRDDAPVAS